jgi:hypothetical protein
MFTGGFLERDASQLHLEEIPNTAAFIELIHYIYTGAIARFSSSMLFSLYKLALRFQVEDLVTLIATNIAEHVAEGDALDILLDVGMAREDIISSATAVRNSSFSAFDVFSAADMV